MQMSESLNNGMETRAVEGACIVVCANKDAVRQLSSSLVARGAGRILSYDNLSDFATNIPVFNVDMVVLSGDVTPQITYRMLRWIRRQWRNCVSVVVGNLGQRDVEIAARRGGAFYLATPTAECDWDIILDGVRQNREYCMSQN